MHQGDVIVEDGDLLGDSVNVAARLEALAEPGSICISARVYEDAAGKMALQAQDMGEQSLKNIARPVRVYRVDPELLHSPPTSSKRQVAASKRPSSLPLPDKPSMAVMPFQNMSDDPAQDYFTDGMVEDIITALSRVKSFLVIARNSSFTYKGKGVDIKQVGRELGVRYVLGGSVRKAGNRVRITGQLVEAESGAHLWADRYDGALEDVFDLQDKMTESIAGVIEPNLRRAEIERARRKRPDSLGAYDLYLRALPHLVSVMPEDANIAMGYLEEALRLDPNYAAAHAFMAWGLEMRVARGGFSEADAIAGVRHARAALAYGSDDATALAIAALTILHLAHDFEAAKGAISHALSLNGSCATALYFGAHIHAFSGDPTIAEDYANRALRLSPFDPLRFAAYQALALVRLREERFDEATSNFAKAAQANPRFSWLYAEHAAALAMAGRIDESRSVARRLLELEPTFHIRPIMEFLAFMRPELVSALSAGLRQSSLPE